MINDHPTRATEEEVGQLLVAHQTQLKGFLQTIIHDPTMAEDTLSDVSFAVLQSWKKFDATKSFFLWVRGIARNIALANLRKAARQPILLEPRALDGIADELHSMYAEMELEFHREVLDLCLGRLRPTQQNLISSRYFNGVSYPEMEILLQQPVASLYVTFNRLHGLLRLCVQYQFNRL
jgi:RNA polymerase sigma factor (sigma-70 family)